LILVSLPIAGFVIYYGLPRPPRTTPSTPAATTPVTSSATAGETPAALPATPSVAGTPAAGAPATNPPGVAAGAVPLPTGLAMGIAPKGDVFVSVTVDGEQVFSGLMHAGDTRQVAARDEISLNVGDAGMFAYTLNGKEGRPLGAPGEVVSKRITLADSKDYVSP
jgi:cytoskeleton protein RodZ